MSNGVSNLQQRHLHMYPVILTSSCRQRGRLFAQERNLSKHRHVTRSKGVWNHPPPPYCSEEQAEGRAKFSIGTEKMFDQEISFDPVVNMLYTMRFRSQGNGPREKSTRNLYCRIFSLRHYDRREPRRSCRCRGSQGSETVYWKFHKGTFKGGEISNCWRNLACTIVGKRVFDQEAIEYAKLLKKAKEAAEKYKEKKFDEGKPSATKEPQQCCQKKFLRKRLVNRTRHSKRAD